MRNNLILLFSINFLILLGHINLYAQTTAMQYKELGNSFVAKKDYYEAINQYKKAIEIDSNFADCFFNIGLSYFKLGNYDESIKYYSIAIYKNHDDPDYYANRGISEYFKGDYLKSIEDYSYAITHNHPKMAELYSMRADSYAALKEYDLAMSDYNKSIEIDPNNKVVYYNKGTALKDQNKLDDACICMEKACQLGHEKACIYINDHCKRSNK
jgi:tetratricopeptide (TPR) repeat protein